MKQLAHLLTWEFKLLNRNKVIPISVAVTVLYLLAFQGLQHLGDLDKLLILVIFNDPALLGFLFVGVMVLFEKNENTLQALSVSPMQAHNYLLSKGISLTIISVLCCLAMAWVVKGLQFNHLHFIAASIFTTGIFAFMGFVVVAGVNSFNRYIIRAIGVIFLMLLPFLSFFDLAPYWLFVWLPTHACIALYSASFDTTSTGMLLYAYLANIAWLALAYYAAYQAFSKHVKQ